jgi:hypothetical protein
MQSHRPVIKKISPHKAGNPENDVSPYNNLGSYEDFLASFQKQGYSFCFFHELAEPEKQVVLRHDVDFDTHFALRTAEIEAEMGIYSTYFFLVRSNFYNIFSNEDHSNILKIRELGHQISLHFDPVVYEDFQKGLLQEARIFQSCFEEEVKIISFHRPNKFFQEYDAPVHGIEHTYQSKYFRDVKYFSDSTGLWRFGHPVDSQEFAERKSLHVLIHPIWWIVPGHSNLFKLETYFASRIQNLKQEFSDNCIPFREIHGHI